MNSRNSSIQESKRTQGASLLNQYTGSTVLALMSTVESDFLDGTEMEEEVGLCGYGSGASQGIRGYSATSMERNYPFSLFERLSTRTPLTRMFTSASWFPEDSVVTPTNEFALVAVGRRQPRRSARIWCGLNKLPRIYLGPL